MGVCGKGFGSEGGVRSGSSSGMEEWDVFGGRMEFEVLLSWVGL